MRIPVINSTRKKNTTLLYMTYVLNFPDGDQWIKQEPFSAHDLDHMLKNMIAQYASSKNKSNDSRDWKNRAMALWKTGETWWKDSLGVEHLILLENKKQPAHRIKWGVSKAGMIDVTHGVDENGKKPGSTK